MTHSPHWLAGRFRIALGLGILLLIGIAGAACGPATSTEASSAAPNSSGAKGGASASGGAAGQYQGQYQIKSLAVDMQVKDTRQVASDLESWVATTDTRSQTAGIDYEQVDGGQYRVSVTFSVQATLYPQIERYLADYAGSHGGTLISLHETVQDVTNDYIDTQSRLANLRAEQQRLQSLIAQAGSLTDVLAIDQRLTDVEGQIESTEAHLSALNSQTTFYNVTVTLEPNTNAVAAASSQFDPGGTLITALHAALDFGEFLVSVLIWLVVFSIFLLPVALIWLFVRRFRQAREVRMTASLPAPVVPSTLAVQVPAGSRSGPLQGPPAPPMTAPGGPPANPPAGPSA